MTTPTCPFKIGDKVRNPTWKDTPNATVIDIAADGFSCLCDKPMQNQEHIGGVHIYPEGYRFWRKI